MDSAPPHLGCWQSPTMTPAFAGDDIVTATRRVRESAFLVQDPHAGAIGVAHGGETVAAEATNGVPHFPLLAVLPPLYPEWLGCRSFGEVHGVRFPYVSGAMANGLATTDLVIAMADYAQIGVVLLKPLKDFLDGDRPDSIDDNAQGTVLVVLAEEHKGPLKPHVPHARGRNQEAGLQPGTP